MCLIYLKIYETFFSQLFFQYILRILVIFYSKVYLVIYIIYIRTYTKILMLYNFRSFAHKKFETKYNFI